MKTIAIAMLIVLSTGTAAVLRASDGPVGHAPLRNADCIDTSQINDWHVVSDRTAIVRTGPKHYLITLQTSCPQLSHPPGLMFHTQSHAMTDQGKICGGIGETVRSRGQPACAIQSVSLIDKDRFNQLSADAKRYNGGAAPRH